MSKYATLVVKNLTSLNEAGQGGASPQGPMPSAVPGEKFYDPIAGKSYMYVKFTGGTTVVATANGAIAYWIGNPNANSFQVTSTLSYAGATTAANNQNFVAGIFLGVVTSGNFTLIQRGGVHTALVDTTADKQGAALIASATTNGELVGVAAGTAPTNRVIAWAVADQASGAIAGNIVLDGGDQ